MSSRSATESYCIGELKPGDVIVNYFMGRARLVISVESVVGDDDGIIVTTLTMWSKWKERRSIGSFHYRRSERFDEQVSIWRAS